MLLGAALVLLGCSSGASLGLLVAALVLWCSWFAGLVLLIARFGAPVCCFGAPPWVVWCSWLAGVMLLVAALELLVVRLMLLVAG